MIAGQRWINFVAEKHIVYLAEVEECYYVRNL